MNTCIHSRSEPNDALLRQKVVGMANTYEVWIPCEYCDEEGEVLEDIDIEYTDEDGEQINQTVFCKIECPHCKGDKGQWDMEVDE